jgi:RimJ/RimL family protein N-acetyltransferase
LSNESAGADFTPISVTLRDDRRVTLRSIRSDDGDAMQVAMGRLSGEARYMRFMAAVKALSPDMLKHAVNPVAGRDLALVALADAAGDEAGRCIVAGARYIAGPDQQTCEFGIALTDDWCGAGLASRLMQELIHSARARGLKGMEGFILSVNIPMRKLAKRLGFRETTSREEPGVVRVWLDLDSAQAGRTPGGQGAV